MSNRAYYAQERAAAFERDGYACVICGGQATQAAHIIPRRVWTVRKYGRKVIDSRHNLVSVCGLACNAAAQARVSGNEIPDAIAADINRRLENGNK